MSAAAAPQASHHAALDGLRGLAALMVIASHASHLGLPLVPGVSFAGIGKPGVYLFFALSAWLLTAQWLRLPAADWRRGRTWWRYALRRAARIYPLYTLVLLVGWALAPRGLGVALDARAVWQHLSLQDGQGIYWSVPVEVHYYGLLPLVALALRLPLPRALQAMVLAVAVAAALWAWPSSQAPENGITLGYYLPVFLLGSLAAWWCSGPAWRASPEGSGADRRAGWLGDGLFTALLVLTLPQVLHLMWPGLGYDALHRQYLAWGLAWALAIVGLRSGWLPRWSALLARPGLQACGHWCFGLYLLHLPVLALARRLPLPAVLSAWLGLALALALAAAAHRWLEQPVQRWAQRVTAG